MTGLPKSSNCHRASRRRARAPLPEETHLPFARRRPCASSKCLKSWRLLAKRSVHPSCHEQACGRSPWKRGCAAFTDGDVPWSAQPREGMLWPGCPGVNPRHAMGRYCNHAQKTSGTEGQKLFHHDGSGFDCQRSQVSFRVASWATARGPRHAPSRSHANHGMRRSDATPPLRYHPLEKTQTHKLV